MIAATSVLLAGCLRDEGDEETEDDGRTGPILNGRELDSSFPLVRYDAETGDRVGEVHYHERDDFTNWHQQPLELVVDEPAAFIVEVLDESVELLHLGPGSEYDPRHEPPDATSRSTGSRHRRR